MYRKISLNPLDKVLEGVNAIADVVTSTLGAKGRNVVLYTAQGIKISKDGFTVSESINLEDNSIDASAQLLKNVARRTVIMAGDGTTTSILLAQGIVKEGIKKINNGANPMDLKRGIDIAVKRVVEYINESAIVIDKDSEELKSIATISANNNAKLGELIADGYKKIKKNGIITVGDSKDETSYVDVLQGTRIDNGFISPYFINRKTGDCELVNPYILIVDYEISMMSDLFPIIEKCFTDNDRHLLIICRGMEGEALSFCVANHVNRKLTMAVVRATSLYSERVEQLEDIAIVTGAKVVSEENGLELKHAERDVLGSADKVIVNKQTTTIINGHCDPEKMQERIQYIEGLMNEAKTEYKENYLGRIAHLDSGVAILYIGAITDVEMSERKDLIDDALHATRAAISDGIIVGGGVAYIRAISWLNEVEGSNEDENLGIDIIRKVLTMPVRKMAENAGLNGEVVLNEILKSSDNMYGYNFLTDKYEDLMKSGVIDPVKVTRVALENAASVASLLITTSAIISEEQNESPEKNS